MGLGLALANIGGVAAVALPNLPSTNLLGWWSARSTVGTPGASSFGAADLSGNGHNSVSVSGTNPIQLTSSDPLFGNTPSLKAVAASSGCAATLAAFNEPITLYMVAIPTVTNADLLLVQDASLNTWVRLFAALAGTVTYSYRVPGSGNQISVAGLAAASALVSCAIVDVSSGTFNAFIGRSTPANGTGAQGVLTASATSVQLINGNTGGVFAEAAIYSGADSQATRFSNMNILAQRCNLAAITS